MNIMRKAGLGTLAIAAAMLTAGATEMPATAESASAHPVPGCNGRSFPGYKVQHLHLRAVTVCKAFRSIGGGRFQVIYKIKGNDGPRLVKVRNDGTVVRTYNFVRKGAGTIQEGLKGKSTHFTSCRPNGTACGPWA